LGRWGRGARARALPGPLGPSRVMGYRSP
jgi:hypothetical protein